MTAIRFGFKKEDRVELYEFCSDPDGSVLQWYRSTNKFEPLAGRERIGESGVKYDGKCTDTAEFTSRLGELARMLVVGAPAGTSLVALVADSSCGTRTFSESLKGEFYR